MIKAESAETEIWSHEYQSGL